MPRLWNESKGTLVAERVRVADSRWSRFWGLLGRRSLPEGHGLLLKDTASVHTSFMQFVIDVVFLDGESRVVKVVPQMRPFRIAATSQAGASSLELPAGTAARALVEPGDRLVIGDGRQSRICIDKAGGTTDNLGDPCAGGSMA